MNILKPVLCIFVVLLSTTLSASIYYVDGEKAVSGSGISWNTAFRTVQEGIDVAAVAGGGDVWVKAGTYTIYENSSADTVLLKDGVNVYGGFSGTESFLGDRDFVDSLTILDGFNSVTHVVTGADNTIIDGFVITRGYALPSGLTRATSPDAIISSAGANCGGGMLIFQCAPTVINCTFRENNALKGGAVYVMVATEFPAGNANAAPTFDNCKFLDNSAQKRGGAISLDLASNPTFANCIFLRNECDAKGGALYNDFGCSPILKNCLFARNRAERATAIGCDGASSPKLINCTITDNWAKDIGAGVYTGSYNPDSGKPNSPVLVNCIVWGNKSEWGGPVDLCVWHENEFTMTNCVIGHGVNISDVASFNQDPLFVDQQNGDYSLQSTSPCINAGDSNDSDIMSEDIVGNSRIGTVDIGAYEYISFNPEQTTGLFVNQQEAAEGFTLFAPMQSTTTYLINNAGEFVHSWVNTNQPGLAVYLEDTGNLLRTASTGNVTFDGGGAGGKVEEIAPDGTVVWEFSYSSDQYLSHHDVERLPNGNVLIIAWQRKTADEALAAGRSSDKLIDGELWADSIIEVQPNGENTGTVVWEWHVWDHLIQNKDVSKPNYGAVEERPERIDLNFTGTPAGSKDWIHINSVDYNPELDQVLVSVHELSEIWIVDHSTTTVEAATSSGGRRGKGGDLLYRWGNPQAYGTGNSDEQKLFKQHDACWIKEGYSGSGNITIFNNGLGRPSGSYSTIEQIVPPVDEDGNYTIPTVGNPYAPLESVWSYQADNSTDLYGKNISGAQRLSNGNTLICEGPTGRFFEVTDAKEVVWEYINPVVQDSAIGSYEEIPQTNGNNLNQVFKISRYPFKSLAITNLTAALFVNITVSREVDLLSWTEEAENGIVTYNVEQFIDGQWTVIYTIDSAEHQGTEYQYIVSQINSSYRIVVIDKFKSETSVFEEYSPTSTTINVLLNEGWNMLSLPFDSSNLSELYDGTVGNLWSWNGGSYSVVENLVKQHGFWAYCSKTDKISFTGDLLGTGAESLSSGWNFLGPLQNCQVPSVLTIYSWEDGNYRLLEEGDMLESGKGYWFFSEEDTELTLK